VKTTSVGERLRGALPDSKPSIALEKTVRDWLVADQEFNVWFLETTKGALDDATKLRSRAPSPLPRKRWRRSGANEALRHKRAQAGIGSAHAWALATT